MLRFFCVILPLFASFISYAQDSKKQHWVDSVFATLKKEQKIGQTIISPFSSRFEKEEIKILADHIASNKVGALFIVRSSPTEYVQLINQFQEKSRIPLLISTDFDDDLSITFDSVTNFYGYQKIKSISNSKVEIEIERQRKLLGVNAKINSLLTLTDNLIPIPAKEIDASIKRFSKKLKKDKTLVSKLDLTVKEILGLKYDAGLHKDKFIDPDNLISKLNSPEARLLKQQLAQSLVYVAKNDSNFLPIKNLYGKNFASINIGDSSKNEFTHYLSKYANFKNYSIQTSNDTTVFSEVKNSDIIIVGLFKKIDSLTLSRFKKLKNGHEVILCDFSKNNRSNFFSYFPSVISAHSNEEGIPQAATQIIFGSLSSKLESVDSMGQVRFSRTDSLNRLSYQLPEAAGMDSRALEQIESIAKEAIEMKATPGMNVLVAKDGKVVYEKSFGSFTYENKRSITDETIFDLASITKVSATLQAVMYMQEKGVIDINKKASVYLPELKKTNKEDFIIKDILTHQAGLWPFLPFWAETVKDTSVWKTYYSKTSSEAFPYPVAKDMYAAKSMKDSLWQWIIKSKVRDKTVRTNYDYRYSDMGFYMLQHLAEKILNMPIEDFLQKTFYQPIGAYTMGYQPLKRFSSTQIAPTEKDTLFRKSLLIGYVHDQGAAMHGGVAGHAGLFSNANDLAKLGQMWLNKGSYGGIQYFKPETIELFTAQQYENNRRGLGWDKPVINDPNGPTSMYSSSKTFGHTGFTGTSIWVDPEFNLVFVFLSNRVYPDMNNTKIINANIRPRIQDVVYRSIFNYCKK